MMQEMNVVKYAAQQCSMMKKSQNAMDEQGSNSSNSSSFFYNLPSTVLQLHLQMKISTRESRKNDEIRWKSEKKLERNWENFGDLWFGYEIVIVDPEILLQLGIYTPC